MKIAEYRFHPEDLTAAEIQFEDKKPWAFLPFETEPAYLHDLDGRFVFAAGHKGSFAIFDAQEQRQVVSVASKRGSHLKWAYAPRRRSVCIPQNSQHDEPKACNLLELPLDGSAARVHVPDKNFFVMEVAERDDGKLVLLGHSEALLYDPETNDVERHPFPGFDRGFHWVNLTRPQWISPNGRMMLRPHLGSVIRTLGTETGHVDLKPDGQRRYGVALDVYSTGPVCHLQRLVIQYLTVAEWFPAAVKPDGSFSPLYASRIQVFDELADQQDYRTWDGHSQLMLTVGYEEGRSYAESEKLREFDKELARDFVRNVHHVTWDADSSGFTAVLERPKKPGSGHREHPSRHVSLNGEVGPVLTTIWSAMRIHPPLPSEPAIKTLRKYARDKATQRIALVDATTQSLLAACEEMASRIEAGLKPLIFRNVLKFRFKIGAGGGSKTLGEKQVFGAIGKLPSREAKRFVPPMRRIMDAYSRQVGEIVGGTHDMISSGGDDDKWRAALSDVAIALAKLDPNSFEVLRGWFQSIDQEHDTWPANKVFPTIAKRCQWASPDAVRFGIWFHMRQWQAVSYKIEKMGLIEAAERFWEPVVFRDVVLEEAERIDDEWGGDKHSSDLKSRVEILKTLLKQKSGWQAEVRALLPPTDDLLDA